VLINSLLCCNFSPIFVLRVYNTIKLQMHIGSNPSLSLKLNFTTMYKLLVFITVLLTGTEDIFTMDSTIFNYYPLKIGNSWTYYSVSGPISPSSYKYKLMITDTVRINSHLYYKFIQSGNNKPEYRRIDSANGNILKYSSNGCPWLYNDILIDSLNSKLQDVSKTYCTGSSTCNDTSVYPLFNISVKSKKFENMIYTNYR